MATPEPIMDLTWREIAFSLGAFWLAALSWFARTLLVKIDDKVNKADLTEVLKRMDQQNVETREARKAFYERIDETLRRQQQFNLEIARYMGAVEKMGSIDKHK